MAQEQKPKSSQISVGSLARPFTVFSTVFFCCILTSVTTTNAEVQEKSSLLKTLMMTESRSRPSVKILPRVNDVLVESIQAQWAGRPGGGLGPSGQVRPPIGPIFPHGQMGPVRSINPERLKEKEWVTGPDGPILVGPSGQVGPGVPGNIVFPVGPMGPVKSIDPERLKEKGWVIGPDGPILVGPSGPVLRPPGGMVFPHGSMGPVRSINPARWKEKGWVIGPNGQLGSSGSIGSSGLVGPGGVVGPGGPIHFSRVGPKESIRPIESLTEDSEVPK